MTTELAGAGARERVLVVDDEPAILDALVYALEREGYDVVRATNGEEALERALGEGFDAVVLDVMLPGLPGTEVARRVRAESAVPILLLTARGAEVDRVVGLELGADDYVAKPFSMAELLARVRALLRRRRLDREEAAGRSAVRRVGGLELDLLRHEARVDGRPVELTPSEFRLLELLSSAPETVFDRRAIVRHLWRSDYTGDERACDTHVANLRKKVERDPARPQRIVTVRGVGYKLASV